MIEPKLNKFHCYNKNIFIVKSYEKTKDNYLIIDYYFRTSFQPTTKLDENDTLYKIHPDNLDRLKLADKEHKDFLVKKILEKHPEFDFFNIETEIPKKSLELNEKDCIEFLKKKGYMVYKQV